MASLQTFEELETWKACRAFRIFIAKNVTPKLLNQREYSLADPVICANDDELISTEILTETRQLFDHAAKVLNGYMSYLAKSATKSQ